MATLAVPQLGDEARLALRREIALAARTGLTSDPKSLPPWLLYDARGSDLFEEITELPEYYLTRTERAILVEHADEIVACASGESDGKTARLNVVELGAGTAAKTGVLLKAIVRRQKSVLYQPVDVSASALEQAGENLQANVAGVSVKLQVADYTREALALNREDDTRTLALYIGSSVGNFSPVEAGELLQSLRSQLRKGDWLLLGTDMQPGGHKDVASLLAAYDDAKGVTAEFNRNVLVRLNRELGTDFEVSAFRHVARWNADESRMEMHLESLRRQRVMLPADGIGKGTRIMFSEGETIHTENSYKFSVAAIDTLLGEAGFSRERTWMDEEGLFAVSLGCAV